MKPSWNHFALVVGCCAVLVSFAHCAVPDGSSTLRTQTSDDPLRQFESATKQLHEAIELIAAGDERTSDDDVQSAIRAAADQFRRLRNGDPHRTSSSSSSSSSAPQKRADPSSSVPTVRYLNQLVPSLSLPSTLDTLESNNCLALYTFQQRLFLGWRSSLTHFASNQTRMFIVSSTNQGNTWDFELEIRMGSDVREPFFVSLGDTLAFSFFEAGIAPFQFQPKLLWRTYRTGLAQWTPIEQWGSPEEIVWQIQVHNNVAYATSYRGAHYSIHGGSMNVFFNASTDLHHWYPVNTSTDGVVYSGGVSEVGFTFDDDGNLWGVMRNEDGDDSRWGSRVVFASANNYGNWQVHPEPQSNPWIYESPRMFTHRGDVYLVGRRDVDGPYDWGRDDFEMFFPFAVQKSLYLSSYSLRPHTTALYRVNRDTFDVEWLVDLFGCGDTAFPSILQTGDDTFWIANYSSPLSVCEDWSWLQGQISPLGTQIYVVQVQF